MRKWAVGAIGLAMMCLPAAQARAVVLVDLPWNGSFTIPSTGNNTGGSVTTPLVNGMDLLTSGVAVVDGFAKPPAVGDVFNFRFQATIVAVTDDLGSSIVLPAADANDFLDGTSTGGAIPAGHYQLTAVAQFHETVVAVNGPQVLFAPAPQPGDLGFQLYYDDPSLAGAGTRANVLAGTGLNDGTKILAGDITTILNSLPSNFTEFTATSGSGTVGNIGGPVSLALGAFFQPANLLNGVALDGTITESATFTSSVTGLFNPASPGGATALPTAGAGEEVVVLNTDASAQFTTIPEPGTLLLLGAGLLGFAGRLRRRT